MLARLWDAVAPGGHLVVQDYDLASAGTGPTCPTSAAVGDLIRSAFTAAGCEVRAGALLPRWFHDAGIGSPDGTDVAGRLDRLVDAARMLEAVARSLVPVAVRHGLITETRATPLLERLHVRRTGRPGAADPVAAAPVGLEAQGRLNGGFRCRPGRRRRYPLIDLW